MPGDTQECREHAASCKRLADMALTPEAREHFISLAVQWERLAAELDSSAAFIRAMKDVDLGDAKGRRR